MHTETNGIFAENGQVMLEIIKQPDTYVGFLTCIVEK